MKKRKSPGRYVVLVDVGIEVGGNYQAQLSEFVSKPTDQINDLLERGFIAPIFEGNEVTAYMGEE